MVNFAIAGLLVFIAVIPIRRAYRRGRIGGGVATELVIMALGFFVWAVPAARLFFPNNRPVAAIFPLNAGGVLQENFTVRTSENYGLYLVCEAVEPFRSEWETSLNGTTAPTIECDLDVRILRRGETQERAILKSIHRSWQSGNSMAWSLGNAHLSAGRYELLIVNQGDLTRLAPARPTVEMSISSIDFKDRVIDYQIGLYVGAPIFLIGLISAAIGWLVKAGRRAGSRRNLTNG